MSHNISDALLGLARCVAANDNPSEELCERFHNALVCSDHRDLSFLNEENRGVSIIVGDDYRTVDQVLAQRSANILLTRAHAAATDHQLDDIIDDGITSVRNHPELKPARNRDEDYRMRTAGQRPFLFAAEFERDMDEHRRRLEYDCTLAEALSPGDLMPWPRVRGPL